MKDILQIKEEGQITIRRIIKKIDSRLSSGEHRLGWYFGLYTLLFVLVCGIVFCWYFLPGRTFIWQSDGWTQHFKALVYYAKYMRSIIRELLYNHQFVIPEWDFAFGEGNDILQTLHYYVIGDPFAVFSVFVPVRFLWIYYDFMILLRLYLSGIAFSCLCFYTRKNIGRHAVMAGALSYVFCYWAIYNVNRHPYFLNPMLYFPLIILGIEKLLRKEKPYLLTVSVFLAAISNFYYFYVIVFMTAAYVAVRLITKYRKDFKSMLRALLRIGGGAALGTVMGGIILVPVCFAFLNDTRMAFGNAWHLIYPLSYYSSLLGTFFGGGGNYWLRLGYAAPVILAVFLLFLQRGKNSVLKVCFLVCSVIILIPALGQFLNGISYMSNKWCWAFALLCAYIFAAMWPDMMSLKFRDAVKLLVCLCICFFGLIMFEYSRTMAAFSCIGIAFIFLFVVFPFHMENPQKEMLWGRRKQIIALVLVIVGVANVSFFKNAAATGNYAKEGREAEDVSEQLMLSEANAVKDVAGQDGADGFYRYSGRSLTYNANILAGLSSTQYYWSISNPYIADYRKVLELLELSSFNYIGYDDRTSLITLSSVLYYVVPSGDMAPLPYGFTYVDEFNIKENITEEAKALLMEEFGEEEVSEDRIKVIENATASKYKIYRNDHALPMSYAYDKVISEDTWETLSAVEKQEAMLQSVVLAGYDGETEDGEISYTSRSLDYTVDCDSTGITLEDYGFVVTTANSSATISFEGVPDSEIYFAISGLDFDGVSTYELYFGDEKYDPLNLFTETRWDLLSYAGRESIKKDRLFWTEPTSADLTIKSSSGISKTITYRTEDYTWYNDCHDITVNLDYTEDAVTSFTLTFSSVGVYSFDSIEVVCQPMDGYAEQVSALKEHGPDDIRMGTDTVTGTISLDEASVLCLTIPYSTGWTAYVDGEEAELYQANIKYMALVLDAGMHEVELVYHTPYLRLGAVTSVVGFIVFFAFLLLGRSFSF